MNTKKKLLKSINKLPYIRGLNNRINQLTQQVNQFDKNSCFPAGHYLSPIISVETIKENESSIWPNKEDGAISGIDLRIAEQRELMGELSVYYREIPFQIEKQSNLRYYFNNDWYSYTDAIILYSLIRHLKPKRIVEIGSGFSSAVMLDTNDLFFKKEIQLTFIEPYPERLISLLSATDKRSVNIVEALVQDVPLATYETLEAGDILFVDSSHIVKTGSDVNHILFEILPLLKPGVYIHFHDIFHPFEYPKEWVYGGRNWNEDYFLKAFLMYNMTFEICLFSDYLHKYQHDVFKEMPLSYKNFGGNLWVLKK